MDKAHQIVGEIVAKLIRKNSPIDFEIIKDCAVEEFMRASKSDIPMDEKREYEKMLKIFAVEYHPKF
ncbi:TPA: hypothetical protein ACIAIE_004791 [Serratia fonticola]